MSTLESLEGAPNVDSEEILAGFLEYVDSLGASLYDHQEEAILELYENKSVILNTPTGSGKSMVALAVHYRGLCQGRRSYYTVPIKALANEKFLSLCRTFGPDRVGMITGDATVNPSAPIICCTAEILSNLALREGGKADVDDVIMDEFHYYSDRDRGSAWQIPLLLMPHVRFLLMSATIGDTTFFQKEISEFTGVPCVLVKSENRPVPLHYEFSVTQMEEKVCELVEQGKAPVYLVHFGQLSAARTSQNLLSWNFCSKEEKRMISEELQGMKFSSPYGKELSKLLRHGVGIHHAGLLPKYRVLVEKLAQKGLLKVICGTDTLGVGVNVPIRTVMFTQLCKFDGQGTKILTVRDFKQIAGRAGRRGFDDVGYVVAQAPEHVIENIRMEAKAAGKKRIVKKKPPERGFIPWNEETFQKLISSPSEKLVSSFQLRHSMLLNILGRKDTDGCRELQSLLDRCHEGEKEKKALRKHAWVLFKALVSSGVLELIAPAERSNGIKVILSEELQEDFSMNQALGLYLLEVLPELDQESPTYVLDVVSLVEAIVEHPHAVLRSQENKAKKEVIQQLKDEGVSYDERMEALEEVSWPKPLEEFIYHTFNQFVLKQPWISAENVRPKSVVREMLENYQSFPDYINEYSLERSEAVLLRHVTEVYKILEQTVPPVYKTEDFLECETWLKELLEGVDSSLLDEWERLRDPNYVANIDREDPPDKVKIPLSQRKKEFESQIRTRVMEAVKYLSYEKAEDFLACFDSISESSLTVESLYDWFDLYYETHQVIRLDPEARNKKYWRMREQGEDLMAQQVLVDSDMKNDFLLDVRVDRSASDLADRPVLSLVGIQAVMD